MIPASLAQVPVQIISAAGDAALSAAPALQSTVFPSPPDSQMWSSIGRTLTDGFGGEAGLAAQGAVSLAGAAAGVLDSDAVTGAAAILEGSIAIASAVAELAQIAMEFITSAIGTITSAVAAGPAASAMALPGLIQQATTSLGQAAAVVARLESQLAGPTAQLEGIATKTVHIPDEPRALTNGFTNAAMQEGSGGGSGSGTGSGAGFTQASDTGDGSADGADVSESAGDGAPTPEAQAAVQNALSAVGTPYVWGGNTPGVGLDCSGLTQWAYREAGVDIPRTAAEQTVGRQVSADELLPGDLVIWSGHVAMVTGDGMMVEAGDPVQVNPVRTSNIGMEFHGYWRPTG